MRTSPITAAILLCLVSAANFASRTVHAADRIPPPATMPVPANYREWVYLTSGLDMTYDSPSGAGLPTDHHSVFDNVFVNPEAYRSFVKTGAWPDETTFVLENRAGESDVSINKAGRTQGAVTGIEIHAKLHGEWAFYVRAKDGGERLITKPASCYTCHEAHAAVDTTFTQFYPTLLPIAKEKNTLSERYIAESTTRTESSGAVK